MPSSFGMKDSVISLICVAAWKIPTSSPTQSATSSSGAASMGVICSACWPMPMTVSGVIVTALFRASVIETRGQRTHDKGPAIDQNKQHDFERQRYEYRREHHHAHRHQNACHYE